MPRKRQIEPTLVDQVKDKHIEALTTEVKALRKSIDRLCQQHNNLDHDIQSIRDRLATTLMRFTSKNL